MKKLSLFLFLIASIPVLAQTGIGTTTPNASAKLDVYSDNKGFLPPRVTLNSSTDNTTIPTPAEGLLVYNKGSVGLQAGYYYWNGANWTIIATSTVAGSGVVASDLVKLYSKAYSTAVGDIAHAGGFSFTVPVSGRYLFDFSSSGYVNQSSQTITFKIRQNTTDLATDLQTGNNNNVHVEYNGKIEVNLQAGVTYNAVVTSTGSRDAGDYDRVYMKQVAGNLPVNVYPWVLSGNDVYNSVGKVGIGTSSPATKLDVTGDVNVVGALTVSGTSNANISAPALLVGSGTADEGGEMRLALAQTNQSLSGSINLDVYRNNLRIFEGSGSNRGVSLDLSKAPNGVGGELMWKASGIVNAGVDVTLGNLKVRFSTSGYRSIQLSTVTGTYALQGSCVYVANGVGWVTYQDNNRVTVTTTPTNLSGLNFTAGGQMETWYLTDVSNSIGWRITSVVGSGFANNFITIERLL